MPQDMGCSNFFLPPENTWLGCPTQHSRQHSTHLQVDAPGHGVLEFLLAAGHHALQQLDRFRVGHALEGRVGDLQRQRSRQVARA